MHGIVTAVGVFLFMFPAMIAGAVAFKGIFRIYSIVTMTLFIVFGIFTGTMQPQYVANLPTPMMGVWERINTVSYTHLRAHETDSYLVCRLLLEKKKKT